MTVRSITPFLMFEGAAQAALTFYADLFPDSCIEDMTFYGPEGPGKEGTVIRARMTLAGQSIMAIDSPAVHAFGFTPSLSMFVECDSAEELDRLVAALLEGGEALMPTNNYGFSQRFAWVNDRFGVSWQLNFQ